MVWCTPVKILDDVSLEVTAGPEAGRVLLLVEVPVMLGRDPNCVLRITGSGISRQHAALDVLSDGQFEIADLASTNGTVVNGEPIHRHTLVHGDTIRIGANTELRFNRVSQSTLSSNPEGGAPAHPLALSEFVFKGEIMFAKAVRERAAMALLRLQVDLNTPKVVATLAPEVGNVLSADHLWGANGEHDHYFLVYHCTQEAANRCLHQFDMFLRNEAGANVESSFSLMTPDDLCEFQDLLDEAENALPSNDYAHLDP